MGRLVASVALALRLCHGDPCSNPCGISGTTCSAFLEAFTCNELASAACNCTGCCTAASSSPVPPWPPASILPLLSPPTPSGSPPWLAVPELPSTGTARSAARRAAQLAAPAPPGAPPGAPSGGRFVLGKARDDPDTFLDSNTFEIVLVVFGVLLTAVVSAIAVNMRRLRITFSGFLCILIGAGDFSSDVVFARHAILTSTAGSFVAYLPLAFVVAPFLLSTIPLWLIVYRNREAIERDKFARHPGFYSSMLVLALTNLEVLKLIPWRETQYDGFPNSRLLALTFFTTFVEDVPQTVLQITYLVVNISAPDPITVISLGFSLCSIWWRGFRKLIIVVFVRPDRYPAQMYTGRSFLRASLAQPQPMWQQQQQHARGSTHEPPPRSTARGSTARHLDVERSLSAPGAGYDHRSVSMPTPGRHGCSGSGAPRPLGPDTVEDRAVEEDRAAAASAAAAAAATPRRGSTGRVSIFGGGRRRSADAPAADPALPRTTPLQGGTSRRSLVEGGAAAGGPAAAPGAAAPLAPDAVGPEAVSPRLGAEAPPGSSVQEGLASPPAHARGDSREARRAAAADAPAAAVAPLPASLPEEPFPDDPPVPRRPSLDLGQAVSSPASELRGRGRPPSFAEALDLPSPASSSRESSRDRGSSREAAAMPVPRASIVELPTVGLATAENAWA